MMISWLAFPLSAGVAQALGVRSDLFRRPIAGKW